MVCSTVQILTGQIEVSASCAGSNLRAFLIPKLAPPIPLPRIPSRQQRGVDRGTGGRRCGAGIGGERQRPHHPGFPPPNRIRCCSVRARAPRAAPELPDASALLLGQRGAPSLPRRRGQPRCNQGRQRRPCRRVTRRRVLPPNPAPSCSHATPPTSPSRRPPPSRSARGRRRRSRRRPTSTRASRRRLRPSKACGGSRGRCPAS